MSAEFDAVKITLGELKNIENGLVVDLTSLYDNNVTLKVEGNPIASGNLVIVNDRYGVKINQILTNDAKQEKAPAAAETENAEESYSNEGEYEENSEENEEEYNESSEEGSEDEEFDYSDFELEDENI